MIEAFQYINKAFESKVRLGIMAILMVNEEADFNFLKEQTEKICVFSNISTKKICVFSNILAKKAI